MKKILYITYDGLTDPLGQSQVLSYLSELTKRGNEIHILSFEKEDKYKRLSSDIQKICDAANLLWYPQMYTAKPPVLSSMHDLRKMKKEAFRLYQINKFDVIHCRSYMPGMAGLSMKEKFGVPFIFDMRGFWPDEKLESGGWNSIVFKPIYRFFKNKERELFSKSDALVSLTYAGKEEIVKQSWAKEDKVGVIPTCVNFEKFKTFDIEVRNGIRKKMGIPVDSPVFLYSGSMGGNYDITIPFKIFESFLKEYPNAYFLILSKTAPKLIFDYLESSGLDKDRIKVTSVAYTEVGDHLMAGDVGLIFYGDGYSNIGRSPTKLGEYWASGISAVSLDGIGDVNYILDKYPGNGLLFTEINNKKLLQEEIKRIPFSVDKKKLREDAYDYYALEKGVQFYSDIYKKLSK